MLKRAFKIIQEQKYFVVDNELIDAVTAGKIIPL